MPPLLFAQTFAEHLLAEVAHLDFGDDVFGRTAGNWIAGGPHAMESALQSMRDKGTTTWLYRLGDASILGFGSLGPANWRIDNRRQEIVIIPHLGIQVQFQGGPAGVPSHGKYSRLLLRDLIARARAFDIEKRPFLGLYVHESNHKARDLYEKMGFVPIGQLNDEGYQRMLLKLVNPGGASLV
ncbi:MAG: GNAT family N-acetyltransferase [Pirellulales bacterium]|nr:GNAT family N-acetyltransferase [Pirellulales bacterium]